MYALVDLMNVAVTLLLAMTSPPCDVRSLAVIVRFETVVPTAASEISLLTLSFFHAFSARLFVVRAFTSSNRFCVYCVSGSTMPPVRFGAILATVTSTVLLMPAAVEATVMAVVPGATAVTVPSAPTVATLVSPLV